MYKRQIQRGINQMKVIDAMLNKIKSPALLMGFSKIMDAASDCFVTDFSQDVYKRQDAHPAGRCRQ